MKLKPLIKLGMITALFATGCNVVNPDPSGHGESDSGDPTPARDSDKYQIYTLAQAAGYTGTYEEWLASIRGASLLTGTVDPGVNIGQNGDSYLNLSTWYYFVKENNVWVNKGSIMGRNGNNGVSVVSIEKTNNQDLYDTYTITYSDGNTDTFVIKNGKDGANGLPGGDGHTPVITIDPVTYNWIIDNVDSGICSRGNKGDQGNPGNTPTVSIDPTTFHWIINGQDSGVVAKGVDGNPGNPGNTPTVTIDPVSFNWIINDVDTGICSKGTDGSAGGAGKSAYEIYKEHYSYTGTEEQWINDLVNGNLSTSQTHTVSFVTNFSGVNIASLTVNHGAHINVDDIVLPTGYAFKIESGSAYYVKTGSTFSGDFSLYEHWSLAGYGVYSDITLALDIYQKGALRALTRFDDQTIINYYGRNNITESSTTFYATNSGFEVKFFGTKLSAKLTRVKPGSAVTGAPSKPTNMKIRVYIDGDRTIEHSKVLTLDATTDDRLIDLATGLTRGDHTVLVRKVNYDERGYLSLSELSGPEGFYDAPAKPNNKILFYGDSITVGYGVNYMASGDSGGDTYLAEDGTRTYATLLTDYYGAENQTYAISGVSIGVPSWRPKTVLERWNYCSYFANVAYDLTAYNPNLIIMNLGTNDATGLINGATTYGNGSTGVPNDTYTFWHVYSGYFNLIKDGLRNYYPNAKILICYGMLGKNPSIDAVLANNLITDLQAQGVTGVYYLSMDSVETSVNAGHPTINGQYEGFKQIRNFITTNGLLQ